MPRRPADSTAPAPLVVNGAPDVSIAQLVAESRRRQGLPERVEDPATVRRVAALLAGARPSEAAPARHARPRVRP